MRRFSPVYLVPTILLLLVVGIQLSLSENQATEPWKGASFGMFAYIQKGFLRCYIVDQEKTLPCLLPNSVEELSRNTRLIPSKTNLQSLAAKLTDLIRDEMSSRTALSSSAQLYLEYWEYSFMPEKRSLVPRRFSSLSNTIFAESRD